MLSFGSPKKDAERALAEFEKAETFYVQAKALAQAGKLVEAKTSFEKASEHASMGYDVLAKSSSRVLQFAEKSTAFFKKLGCEAKTSLCVLTIVGAVVVSRGKGFNQEMRATLKGTRAYKLFEAGETISARKAKKALKQMFKAVGREEVEAALSSSDDPIIQAIRKAVAEGKYVPNARLARMQLARIPVQTFEAARTRLVSSVKHATDTMNSNQFATFLERQEFHQRKSTKFWDAIFELPSDRDVILIRFSHKHGGREGRVAKAEFEKFFDWVSKSPNFQPLFEQLYLDAGSGVKLTWSHLKQLVSGKDARFGDRQLQAFVEFTEATSTQNQFTSAVNDGITKLVQAVSSHPKLYNRPVHAFQ